MTVVDELLTTLAACPAHDRAQIDESITPKLRQLIGKPTTEQADGLKSILDECAFASLASDFGMMAMDAAWYMALKARNDLALAKKE